MEEELRVHLTQTCSPLVILPETAIFRAPFRHAIRGGASTQVNPRLCGIYREHTFQAWPDCVPSTSDLECLADILYLLLSYQFGRGELQLWHNRRLPWVNIRTSSAPWKCKSNPETRKTATATPTKLPWTKKPNSASKTSKP